MCIIVPWKMIQSLHTLDGAQQCVSPPELELHLYVIGPRENVGLFRSKVVIYRTFGCL